MSEHQQTQQSKKPDPTPNPTFQNQATPVSQIPVSNPYSIIQRAKINPKSLTHADVMQLQRTIGNGAVGKLLSEIGLIPSKAEQTPPVQMQAISEEESICPSCLQKQEIQEEKESLQGKMIHPLQRQEIPEEEEPLQGKMIQTIQRQKIPEEEEKPLQTKRENNTGLPDNLKAGVESLSGIDMSDVRVHYNSSKPAEVGAVAYTQGTDIHVAPGQERHLPHEAWHVVQQAQGRVKPTLQLKDVAVNDDEGLEREADLMGDILRTKKVNVNQIVQKYDYSRQAKSQTIQCEPVETGLAEKYHIKSVAKKLPNLKSRFKYNSEHIDLPRLTNEVQNIVNIELERVGSFPIREIKPKELPTSITKFAYFDKVNWSIVIEESILTDDPFDLIVSDIYHEARHSEQIFRVARLRAGKMLDTVPTKEGIVESIKNNMNIPIEVAAEAVKLPLIPMDKRLSAIVDQANEDEHTLFSMSPITELEESMVKEAEEWDRNYFGEEPNSVSNAEKNLGKLLTDTEFAKSKSEDEKKEIYDAYFSAPIEKDAYTQQDKLLEYFRRVSEPHLIEQSDQELKFVSV